MNSKFTMGKQFTARSNYPLQDGERKNTVYNIKENEKIEILDIDYINNELKVININLQSDNAWVWISEKELMRILRIKQG